MRYAWFVKAVLSPWAVAVLVAAVLTLIAPPLSFVELRVLDGLLALVPSRPVDPRIRLIDVGEDRAPYERWRPRGCPMPDPTRAVHGCEVPRRAYAEAVRRLSRWGAKVVVLDLMFSRPCPAEDPELAQACKAAGNVIVGATTTWRPGGVSLKDPVEPVKGAVWAVASPYVQSPNETIRSTPLLAYDRDTGAAYMAASVLAFERFMGARPSDVQLTNEGWVLPGGRVAPLVRGRSISPLPFTWVDAAPRGEPTMTFRIAEGGRVQVAAYVAASSPTLVTWAGPRGAIQPRLMVDILAMGDRQGKAAFGGTAVIIGRREWDEHWTAVGVMSGPEIQANALSTLLSGDFVRPISPWAYLGVLMAFAAAASWAVRRVKGLRAGFAVFLLMAVALVLARQLLVWNRTWMYLFFTDAGILLSWAVTTQVSRIERYAGLLERLLPGFLKDPGLEGIGRIRERDASLLYTDIRNYTAISEQLRPAEVLRLIGLYRAVVEETVTNHGGAIAVTPGDAVLAVFWRTWNGVGHATCALRAGIELLSGIPALAEAWQQAGVVLDIGVGVNSGPVAMGFLGKAKLEATVVGDAVNLAQRLEALTKDLDHRLLYSESVRTRLEDDVPAVHLGEVSVRGREEPTRVYGIGGSAPKDDGA